MEITTKFTSLLSGVERGQGAFNQVIRDVIFSEEIIDKARFTQFASGNGLTYSGQINFDNIALFKPVQLSSSFAYNNHSFTYGRAATDGNLDLDKYRMGGFGTRPESKPWAILDLEIIYSLDKIVIYHREIGFERTQNMDVSVSQDGENYQLIREFRDIEWIESASTRNKQGKTFTIEIDDLKIDARFIKFELKVDKPTYFHLNQIEVFGSELSGDELVQLNQEAITHRLVGERKNYFYTMLQNSAIDEGIRDNLIFDTFACLRRHKSWHNIEAHARYIENHVRFSNERSKMKFESVKQDFNRNRRYTKLPVDLSKLTGLFPYEDAMILLNNRTHVWRVTSTQFTDKEIDMLLWFQTNWKPIVERSNQIVQENANAMPLNKTYVFWRQGMDSAPELIQLIYKHNMKILDNRIVLLDDDKIREYIDLNSVSFLDNLTQPQYADYLRVTLLAKYGGFWLDATVLVNEEGKHLMVENASPHFVTGRPVSQDTADVSDATVSAYGAEQGNEINRLMQATIELYMAVHDQFPEYFFINRIYNYIIARRPDLKRLVQESDYYLVEGYDSAAQQIFEPEKHLLPQEQEKFEQLMNEPILKLTYKGLHRNKPESVLTEIMNKLRNEKSF